MEGNNTIRIRLEEWAIKPTRAHMYDAGLDLMAPDSINVKAHGSATIDTGVHIEIPEGYAGILKSKSGLNVKYGIISTGTIDAGYTGSVVVKLHNLSDEDYFVQYGDKITQLVLVKIWTPEIEVVDKIGGSERGDAGFGSTGR